MPSTSCERRYSYRSCKTRCPEPLSCVTHTKRNKSIIAGRTRSRAVCKKIVCYLWPATMPATAMPSCCRCNKSASSGCVAVWEGREKQTWLWVRDASLQWDEASNSWVRPTGQVWHRQGLQTPDSVGLYCEACWSSWGRHVKPGCKYVLSGSCEELANQIRVEFHPRRLYDGNPFKCTLCETFLNHGSLEGHLRKNHSAHGKAGPKPTGSTLPTDAAVPVLFVSGCTDDLVSSMIRGPYTTSGWHHHKKPTYQKISATGSNDSSAYIYYWASWNDPKQTGWWMGPSVGGELVWAYNASNTSAEDVLPPAANWRVPWDGGVTGLCLYRV